MTSPSNKRGEEKGKKKKDFPTSARVCAKKKEKKKKKKKKQFAWPVISWHGGTVQALKKRESRPKFKKGGIQYWKAGRDRRLREGVKRIRQERGLPRGKVRHPLFEEKKLLGQRQWRLRSMGRTSATGKRGGRGGRVY